jgi:hypothetical protein
MGLNTKSLIMATARGGLAVAIGIFCPLLLRAQTKQLNFEVDPSWPKPLPNLWITGEIGGVCVDAHDHVFILNRRNLTDSELDAGYNAPPVIEFDPAGNVVNSWGDPDVLGAGSGCFIDKENNVWLAFNQDGIVQKWTHDGSKLLLQIGEKGPVDSTEGTIMGKSGGGMPLYSSHTRLFRPSGLAVDPSSGDIYISDGEEPGNDRVAVFDSKGHFVRQWGLRRTEAEVGDSHASMKTVDCVAIGNDGLVYACDGRGDRIQVFDKIGNFKRNILVPYEQRSQYQPGIGHVPRASGTAVGVAFSPDRAQRLMYIINEDNEQVHVLDHGGGQFLGSFGRVGHQVSEFTHAHYLAVDSKGNIYVGEVEWGRRVQKFTIVGSQ